MYTRSVGRPPTLRSPYLSARSPPSRSGRSASAVVLTGASLGAGRVWSQRSIVRTPPGFDAKPRRREIHHARCRLVTRGAIASGARVSGGRMWGPAVRSPRLDSPLRLRKRYTMVPWSPDSLPGSGRKGPLRAAVVQLEAVHEEVIGSVFHALIANGI